MHWLNAALIALLPLASGAAIQLSTIVYTTEFCLTRDGRTSVANVPTTTFTHLHTVTYEYDSTVTPTTTVKPIRSTVTSTVTATTTSTDTAQQTTDTTTITSTETDSTTVVDTTTSTETDTATTTVTTSTTGTSTIPTSSGFTPVASVPSVQNNGGGAGIPPPSKRDAQSKPQRALFSTNQKSVNRYPQKVTCYERLVTYKLRVVTVTATTTATVTGPTPSPKSITMTTTSTATTTVTPADTTVTASSTTTETDTTTSTSTASTTTTTTQTTTTTSLVAVQTVYAACAANNVLDSVGGQYVAGVSADTAFSGTNDNDMTNPVTCCDICQSTPDCAGWFISNPGGSYDCITIPDSGTCDPTASPWVFYTDASFSESFYVGDGPCGQGMYNGGS